MAASTPATPSAKPPAAKRWPVFASLQGYRRAWVRTDVIAGLTVWAVLVPEALAYATIAGVPPVIGLYAAISSLVLYAAVGSSRHLVVGPMSATAALSAARVAPFAGGDSTLGTGASVVLPDDRRGHQRSAGGRTGRSAG